MRIGRYGGSAEKVTNTVTYAQTVNDPVKGFLKLKVSYGSAKIVKTSEDGKVDGISFRIQGNGIDKTVKTENGGQIQVDNLMPGVYTVTEQEYDRYEPQESRRVTVVAGQVATVNFNNTLKRGDIEVIKSSEDNFNEGVTFHLYGTSLSGIAVDEYAVTDKNGVATFEDVLISGTTPYTIEEVDTAIRYVIPADQTAPVKWNEVTTRNFTNILKKFTVTVTKSDAETGTAQGNASLAGAKYGIFKGEQLIDEYYTDENGQFTTKEYICDSDWTIKELEPSEGYLLDPTVHKVGAEPELYTIEHIAQRADLLGAIRLPNNTFKGNAGTEVVSDILILQKRDRLIDLEPEWVHLNTDENGVKMNTYFVDHPEMVLGEWKTVSGRFGEEDTVVPYENADLAELLEEAISNIHAEITDYEVDKELTEEDNSIPADPEVRNFSYTVVDDKIYYRENSRMAPVDVSATAENRIKGMIAIRDCVRNLIEMQTADYPDYEVEKEQQKLNELYDTFSKKYGLINSRANVSAFSQDSSFALLSALEVLDENGELERKADMFTKRTIKPHTPVTSVDTASEALAVSMGEKAQVDMEYMCSLTGKTEEEVYQELKGVIFLNPVYGYGGSDEQKYLMADEYLSGNVRKKLAWAKKSAEVYPEDYKINVEALEKVQPKDLTASEIFVQLGTTWLPEEIAQQFMYEFLDTPVYARWNIKVHYSKLTGEWNVEGKSYDRGNLKAYNTYGTKRVNAYKIIEDTLNMKDVRVFDYMEDDEGKKRAILNKKETAIAQSKQELIKQGFQDWVWRDPERREKLVRLYNEKFNSIRPREYDGSHIVFSGINPEITLREHQKNAVAHILYGGNTLLAHAVGAGKTYEMTAAAMESSQRRSDEDGRTHQTGNAARQAPDRYG